MAVLVNYFGIGSLVAGLVILAYQIFSWLRSAEWKSVSLLDTLIYLGMNPKTSAVGNWLYVQEGILEIAPLSLFLMLVSVPLFWLAGFLFEREAMRHQQRAPRRRRRKRSG
jgi:hypothetical protein